MSSPARKAAFWLLKIVVSVSLLWILFSRVEFGKLWAYARGASLLWLGLSIALYFLMVVASAWRWGLLLRAVRVPVSGRTLLSSFLVATFFNNFLPSNIGGDFIRIADTAKAAGSKTIATLVVLVDRGIGLLGLVLVAAVGASLADHLPGTGVIGPAILWLAVAAGLGLAVLLISHPTLLVKLLGPARRLHAEWIGERLSRLDLVLTRLRAAPAAVAGCLAGALAVQILLVAFYVAIARSMNIPVGLWQLAVIVPMSALVQILPLSMNGFGVREATWAYYFTSIGLAIEQALLVSFMGAAMIMVFSLSGAAAYLSRGRTSR
ncbi:MAG: flippase-like domain-containing protein [Acidobacteriota bacterium]|nr:flippase-like domain-containing protein [Acidobacteriota bacterium]